MPPKSESCWPLVVDVVDVVDVVVVAVVAVAGPIFFWPPARPYATTLYFAKKKRRPSTVFFLYFNFRFFYLVLISFFSFFFVPLIAHLPRGLIWLSPFLFLDVRVLYRVFTEFFTELLPSFYRVFNERFISEATAERETKGFVFISSVGFSFFFCHSAANKRTMKKKIKAKQMNDGK